MRSRYRTASGSDGPLWVRSRLDCFNTTRCRRTIHKQAGRLRTQDRFAIESVSKLVSEPGAVAMGSNNSAKLEDPVATARGSVTAIIRARKTINA